MSEMKHTFPDKYRNLKQRFEAAEQCERNPHPLELKYDGKCNLIFKNVCSYLVVMEMPPDVDKNTNVNRSKIANKRFAKFRARFVPNVIEIVSILNPLVSISHIENTDSAYCVKYEVGKPVYPDAYNEDIEKVCTNGIHFFFCVEAVLYYLGIEMTSWKKYNDHGFAIAEFCQRGHYSQYQRYHENGKVAMNQYRYTNEYMAAEFFTFKGHFFDEFFFKIKDDDETESNRKKVSELLHDVLRLKK